MARYVGLMSGTSLDGVDVAVVELGGEDERPRPARLVHFHERPYSAPFRRRLRRAAEGGSAEELCELNFELGRRFAAEVAAALDRSGTEAAEVRAVGSHGQTFWHRPPGPERGGATLQLGEPAIVAEATGIPVVADFRVRDVAAGGHGAPLSPYFDVLMFTARDRARAIHNLGGMANVTALPAGPASVGRAADGAEEGHSPVAFDTGPGVAMIDAAAEELSGGEASFDRDGRMAASGRVMEEAAEEWLEDPFFRASPPKSTGRERYGGERLRRWLRRWEDEAPEDLISTLTEVTARSAADAYRHLPFDVDEVYLCGGGARNPELRRRIARRLDPRPVRDLEELGWDGDAREAACFALLARQHVLGLPVRVSWATGAAGPRVLGKRVPA